MDQLDIVEKIQLSYLVQEITGIKGGTDTTTFLWENGRIHNTIPATPNKLRGSAIFNMLRKLPPKAKFNGEMKIYRQGGDIKNWEFE